jgi:ABC-type phosphate transport system substrate-binding protein
MQRLLLTLLLSLTICVAHASDPHSGIVVIVNPASGVDHLTRDEVIDIFLGRYRKLPSGEVALPIDVSEAGSERAQFYQSLVKKSPAEMSSYWARLVFSGQTSPPFQVPDVKTALQLVESNPNAIAYVSRALVSPKVKVVLEIAP